ncbi:MAG TPA: ubiquitin-conjugating enzyme E2 [Candidatus Acidoferrum sp.]|nr:ubiquitin-conjugating enzyme E2 [Candidatus Acidoferrum sp.]
MAARVRDRRIENEWALLSDAQRRHPALLEVLGKQSGPDGDSFIVLIHGTSGLSLLEGCKALISSHRVEIRFPRFFPYVPMEATLQRPVFHPNVDPRNGFVCLWSRFAVEDTVVTALQQLQKVIAWELINQDPRHVIQPTAVEWYNDPSREYSLPLPYTPIASSDSLTSEHPSPPRVRRSRLSQ